MPYRTLIIECQLHPYIFPSISLLELNYKDNVIKLRHICLNHKINFSERQQRNFLRMKHLVYLNDATFLLPHPPPFHTHWPTLDCIASCPREDISASHSLLSPHFLGGVLCFISVFPFSQLGSLHLWKFYSFLIAHTLYNLPSYCPLAFQFSSGELYFFFTFIAVLNQKEKNVC